MQKKKDTTKESSLLDMSIICIKQDHCFVMNEILQKSIWIWYNSVSKGSSRIFIGFPLSSSKDYPALPPFFLLRLLLYVSSFHMAKHIFSSKENLRPLPVLLIAFIPKPIMSMSIMHHNINVLTILTLWILLAFSVTQRLKHFCNSSTLFDYYSLHLSFAPSWQKQLCQKLNTRTPLPSINLPLGTRHPPKVRILMALPLG